MKYSVWGIWLGSAAAILFGTGWVSTLGHAVLWGTLAIHALEFLVKRPVMEAAGGSLAHHFVQTLIYGLFHWRPLEERSKEARTG